MITLRTSLKKPTSKSKTLQVVTSIPRQLKTSSSRYVVCYTSRILLTPPSQILLMLLSKNVLIAHRPKDTEMVKKAADSAVKRYKDMSGRETELEFEDSLNDDSPGGVIGSAMAGRIKVDNTLGERLKILEEKVS
jgi:vacuolar-type H+-ATPase subunit E/Vma4